MNDKKLNLVSAEPKAATVDAGMLRAAYVDNRATWLRRAEKETRILTDIPEGTQMFIDAAINPLLVYIAASLTAHNELVEVVGDQRKEIAELKAQVKGLLH